MRNGKVYYLGHSLHPMPIAVNFTFPIRVGVGRKRFCPASSSSHCHLREVVGTSPIRASFLDTVSLTFEIEILI
jgi:hypothetical protein